MNAYFSRLLTIWLCLLITSDVMAQNRPQATRAWSPSISVVHVTEERGREPSVGAEVVLETWVQSPRGGKELRRTQVGLTNAEGLVTFKRVAIQRSVAFRATTIRDGITFSTPEITSVAPSRPLPLQTFEQTNSPEELTYLIEPELTIHEEIVFVRMNVIVTNPSLKVIVRPLDDGIRAPMLLPAIGDTPWLGYLPTEKAIGNIKIKTHPERGVLRVHRGGIFFSGPIFPGTRSQSWQYSYKIPIHRAELPLVLQSDKTITSLAFSGRWSNNLAPQIHASLPYESMRAERAGRIMHRLTMINPPGEGESARITISGLPYALSAESNLALFGGGFLFVLFLLFALGIRPQE